MPRTNRYFMPGRIWHITHRCHERKFLLKFRRDRKRWVQWLLQARLRYGLSILNYCVTSNHIHLLVYDKGKNEIARSMQLIEGRTGQEYNIRKKREGAFWEDRYHTTMIDSGNYLLRCSSYIDFNMVRAGVVSHPSEWKECGYNEIIKGTVRYRIIDRDKLSELLEVDKKDLREFYNERTEYMLSEKISHEPAWTESIAVGGQRFIAGVREVVKSRKRKVHNDIKNNITVLI